MAEGNYFGLNEVTGAPPPPAPPGPPAPPEPPVLPKSGKDKKDKKETGKKKKEKTKTEDGNGKPRRAMILWSSIHSHFYIALVILYISILGSSFYGLYFQSDTVQDASNATVTPIPQKEQLKIYGKIYGSYAAHGIALLGAVSALMFNDIDCMSKAASPMVIFTIMVFSSIVSVCGSVLLFLLSKGEEQTQYQIDKALASYSFGARGAAYSSVTATFICLVEVILAFFFPARRSVKYDDDYDGELMPELPPDQVEVVTKSKDKKDTKKKKKTTDSETKETSSTRSSVNVSQTAKPFSPTHDLAETQS